MTSLGLFFERTSAPPDTALGENKKKTLLSLLDLSWAQPRVEPKTTTHKTWTKIQTLAVIFCSQLSVGPAGWGWQSRWLRLQAHVRAVEGLWHDRGWCPWRLGSGWALVVGGEAAGRQSAVTGRVGAVAVPSAEGRAEPVWMCHGLHLCSDGRARDVSRSDAGEAGFQWGPIYNCGSDLLVEVSYAQKCVHSLIICIFRYSLIWVHGTDALNMLRCWRGVTWVLPTFVGSFSCNKAALVPGKPSLAA